MYILHRIVMVLHFIGFILMAGTTLIDYLTFHTFWQLVDKGDSRSVGLVYLMAKYGAFIRAGGLLTLLTGVALLALEKGIAWSQHLFKLKVALFVLVILNGIFVGNAQGNRLRETFTTHADFLPNSVSIRESMNRFYPIQLTLFLLILIISLVRPDKLEAGS